MIKLFLVLSTTFSTDFEKIVISNFQTYVFRNQVSGPHYSHVVLDKFFSASVIVNGIKYASTIRLVYVNKSCSGPYENICISVIKYSVLHHSCIYINFKILFQLYRLFSWALIISFHVNKLFIFNRILEFWSSEI